MSLDERAARRVLLAQAIEAGDSQEKLLSKADRDQIDVLARQAAMQEVTDGPAAAPARFLDLRAQRVIQAVEGRHPSLAALQAPGPWQRWLAIGLPLGAIALGVLTDVIANPHRVDLVSLPLLAIVGWNLLLYAALLLGWAVWGRGRPRAGDDPSRRHAEGLLRWRRPTGQARAEVAAFFQLRWQRAARSLSLQRLKKALHLAAAGWAVGIALSLLARGLVVEYRVGWESTFLDAGQVHAILSALRLPALLLFPFQPFSVQEVASLRFSEGGGAVGGARWVLMYVALLLVVIVVPRLLLAAWAAWRERWLARRVPIDVADPYYRRILSLLTAVRVQLCLVTHRPQDRAAALRVLAPPPEAGGTLVASPTGDLLRMVEVPGAAAPPEAPGAGGWLASLRRLAGRSAADREPSESPLAAARQGSDVVLHVAGEPGDVDAAAALLGWLDKPVLVLLHQPAGESSELAVQARAAPLARQVLPFEDFARCWVQERVLLEAIGDCLPEASREGFARIAAAWEQRNAARLERSMAAVAQHLLFAARRVQEVPSGGLSVKSLVPAERHAQAGARQSAMDEVVRRLEVSAGEMFSRLRDLHGLEATDAVALQHRLQEKFVVQQAVHGPQAGMAGAATGAAMGASVDLLVGGLTLGAATALGALVGGGAAYIAAAWKNRSTPGGATVVQLSDEMLQALVEAALLRYLAVAHHASGLPAAAEPLQPSWQGEVVAAVQAHRDRLVPMWNAARSQPDVGRIASTFTHELETIARQVLAGLYPRP